MREGSADELGEAVQELRVEVGPAPAGGGRGGWRMGEAAAAPLEAVALGEELLAALLLLGLLGAVQLVAEAVLVRAESGVDGGGEAEVGLAVAVVVGRLEAVVGGGVCVEVEVDPLGIGCEG